MKRTGKQHVLTELAAQELVPSLNIAVTSKKTKKNPKKKRKHLLREDYMFLPSEFTAIEAELHSPFTLHAACDDDGKNKHTDTTYCSPSNSFLQSNCAHHQVFMNPPFSQLKAFIEHYQTCKKQSPHDTSACIVVPLWPSADFYPLLQNMQLIKEYRRGTPLFTQPQGKTTSGKRRTMPGIPWNVQVYWDPPVPVHQRCIKLAKQQQLNFKPLHGVPHDTAFTFDGQLSGGPVTILIDTGATASFVNADTARRLGLTLQPDATQEIILGTGQSVRSFGKCRATLRLQSYQAPVSFTVLQLDPAIDVVLGTDWLTQHHAYMDFSEFSFVLYKGDKRITIRRPELPASVTTDSQDSAPLLTAVQFKRMLRKNGINRPVYLVTLRRVLDDMSGEDDPLEPNIHPFHPKGENYHAQLCPTDAIEALKAEYADIFPADIPPGLPPLRSVQHTIPTDPAARPPARSPYRLTPSEKEELEKQLKYLLEHGYIAPSASQYAAPVLFVPKPNGTWRMCIDYRALNRITTRDKWPIPRIDDLLDQLRHAKVFSSLDLASGYWQVRITDEDAPKTAFTTHMGLYEFKVLPFGLTNAPATFQRLMNTIFQSQRNHVLVYLDDILVFSKTPEEHLQHLRQVFDTLREQKFYARVANYHFNMPKLKYLGHIVGNGQLSTDPKKMKTVADWPTPTNVTEVRQLLGFAQWFRKFICRFADMSYPLTQLLRKLPPGNSFQWSPEAQQAMDKVKYALTHAPVLRLPDWDLPFEISTDASKYAISAILTQEGQPVAYESRKLIPAETRYDTREREILAIVWACKKWDDYLRNAKFTLYTDHAPLQYLQSQPKLNDRQFRWVQQLQRYDFTVKYRRGTKNPADAPSRRPDYLNVLQGGSASGGEEANVRGDEIQVASPLSPTFTLVSNPDEDTPTEMPSLTDLVRQGYAHDPQYNSDRFKSPLRYEDGLYYRGENLMIPDYGDIRQTILRECHDADISGHLATKKTEARIRQRHLEWPTLRKDVKHWVSTCESCQRNKARNQKPGGLPSQSLEIPSKPWASIGMDFITQLPKTSADHDAILVVVDRLTKKAEFIPTTTTATAPETARLFFKHIFKEHGIPIQGIVCDRDSKFTSNFWKELIRLCGTTLNMSTAFHPQTDGQTERTNRTLEEMLRHYVSPCQDDWDEHLPACQFAYNSSKHESTSMSPFAANYGYEPDAPIDAVLRTQMPAVQNFLVTLKSNIAKAKKYLLQAQHRQRQLADRKRREVEYEVGEKVMVSTANLSLKHAKGLGVRKFLPRYIGPFLVSAKIGPVAYRIDLPQNLKVHNVFHVSLLEKYKPGGRVQAPPPALTTDEGVFHPVDCILMHRDRKVNKSRSVREYLIKWEGYPSEHNSWEPEPNVKECIAYQQYWATQRDSAKHKAT